MSEVLKKLVATSMFAACAVAANAQENNAMGAAAETPAQPGQALQAPAGKSIRYSAGESIVLGAAAPAAREPASAAVPAEPQAASVRYSAGDSIVLAAPQAASVRYSAGDSIMLGAPQAPASVQTAQAAAPQDRFGFSQGAVIPLAGAFGDSVTTHIGINHGNLVEKNGLVNTSAAGLVGLFVIKAGIIYYFDHQPKKIREAGLKATAGVWSGVTMNNLLLIAGASNPISLVGGALFGAYMYHREALALQKEAAAKDAPQAASALQ